MSANKISYVGIIVVTLSFILIPMLTNYVWASEELTHFKLTDGKGSSFAITDNQNLIDLYSKSIFLENISTSEQLGLAINSDDQLKISEIDVYYNDQEHKLLGSDQDVSHIEIKSNVILIDSANTFHSQIKSSTIDMGDAGQHLVFLNSTDYKIDVPQGNFVYHIRVDGNPTLTINDQTYSPIINLSNKIIEIHLTSEGGRVIPVTGNSRIQSSWDKVEIISDIYPLNCKVNNISGKIGISGNDKDIELSSTDMLMFEQLRGTTDIENEPNYQIKVNSDGVAKSITLNGLDINTKLLTNYWYEQLPVIGTIVTIISPTITGIFFLIRKFRRKKDDHGFTLEKFSENGSEYVRILHPTKTIDACSILCNKDICKWWNDNSTSPRHIPTGGGGNVLLPENAEDNNSTITIMSGKKTIRKMKLKDIISTNP